MVLTEAAGSRCTHIAESTASLGRSGRFRTAGTSEIGGPDLQCVRSPWFTSWLAYSPPIGLSSSVGKDLMSDYDFLSRSSSVDVGNQPLPYVMDLNLGWTEFHFQLDLGRPMRRPLDRGREANCERLAPEIVQLSFDDHPSRPRHGCRLDI
jgi:hypothetical protein